MLFNLSSKNEKKLLLTSRSGCYMTFTHGAVRLSQEALGYSCQTVQWNCFKQNLDSGSTNFKDEHGLLIERKMRKLKCCCCPGPHCCLIFAPDLDEWTHKCSYVIGSYILLKLSHSEKDKVTQQGISKTPCNEKRGKNQRERIFKR